MAENSKIQWTHHTFNPWRGCEKVSEGCKHCYAEQLVTKRQGLPLWGKAAPRKVAAESTWREPLRWNRQAEKDGERRRVFCASLADVFEDRPDLTAPRERLFRLIEQTPALDWLLLTKRPDTVLSLVPPTWRERFPRNVWVGCTVENQPRAEERLPHLLWIPSPVRFVSYEPALGPVDFSRWLDASRGTADRQHTWIQWIIVGGESGPGARPFDIAWARSAMQQCKAAGVPVFVKQLGSRPIVHHASEWPGARFDVAEQHVKLLDRKGGDMSEWPEELRVREFPEVRRG